VLEYDTAFTEQGATAGVLLGGTGIQKRGFIVDVATLGEMKVQISESKNQDPGNSTRILLLIAGMPCRSTH